VHLRPGQTKPDIVILGQFEDGGDSSALKMMLVGFSSFSF
jgi:hypothetical protein